MRIISFSKKWDKLKQPEFTTFRFPRKDADKGRDWHAGEMVQVYYHCRQPDREKLGVAQIINIYPKYFGELDDAEAVADGFPGGISEMYDWLCKAHGGPIGAQCQFNKLTLKWLLRPEGK